MQHRPKWPKKLQLLGSLSLKAPPELCPWTTLAHKVPIPLAALSGNECFSLSLRLCFSNDVSWLDDWSLDHTDKNFGPDLPLLFEIDEMWSVDSRKIIKIVATRCQISRLKCTKFDFGWQQLDFVGLLDYF